MPTSHSKVGASSAYRWMACPGSVKLCEGIESKSSSYAEEGTMAHELAANALLGMPLPVVNDDYTFDDHGQNRVGIVTREMIDAIEVYKAECDRIKDLDPNAVVLIEHHFRMSSVHEALFGTSDFTCYVPNLRRLYVVDFKYGAGIPVEVLDNPQMQYYALGALLEEKFPALAVDVCIVQPRCFHPDGPVRRYTIDAIELLDFADDLVKAIKAAEAPDAPLVPGDHCGFCPAAAICPKLAAKVQEVARNEFGNHLSYDPAVLAETLRWLPVLESWIKNTREFAYGEAEHGRCAPGWKLVEKRATRKWIDEQEAAKTLRDLLGSDDAIFTTELISPASAEKLLEKSERGVLEDLCSKESSGFALAPEDDKRPAARMDAKSDFEGR